MAHLDIVAEEHTMILDMEQEIMELKKEQEEMEWLKANLEAAEEAKRRWMKSAMDYKRGWAASREQATNMEILVRNILDETELEDDDENMRELRKMLWDNSDTEKQLEAEYADCDEEANTSAWHEMNVGE